ncbi:hypothetical protein IQ07DRAFT_584478 [Pyrenochaeta sp. DS3sAY3a]|nr:hypothetical protein IQ07DRAFT_584478 [Pyrenochaeta sp. DS3sAY3a]
MSRTKIFGRRYAIIAMLFSLPVVQTFTPLPSPSAHGSVVLNVESLFQHTASRNHKVISDALGFVVSLQSAPTCTRMAAGHLMNECKLLEHAPDFAKSRPEAYLDNVKTEYAAKLAVCELISIQGGNPVPPPHCEILVPSSRACGTSTWFHARAEVPNGKQCYPEFSERQYTQCLKGLQSSSKFWISFSNARQNAMTICQASRDGIDRENHLEMFKNLTEVFGAVTSSMEKTAKDYQSVIREHKQHSEETQASHRQLQEEIQAAQEKAVSAITALDNKFHNFMESSISGLIAALADSHSTEIERTSHKMQTFSQQLMQESSELGNFFANKFQQLHERVLLDLESQHQAQVGSYNTLSTHMQHIHDIVNKTSDATEMTLSKAETITQRLNTLESQTEHIAEGFAFLSAMPAFVGGMFRTLGVTIGLLFLFLMIYWVNRRLAIYTAGGISSVFALHNHGVFELLGHLPSQIANVYSQQPITVITSMSPAQKGATLILALWISAYFINHINRFLGHILSAAVDQLLSPRWVHQYGNEEGMGLLPNIEVPHSTPHHKSETHIHHDSRLLMPSAYETSDSLSLDA